MKDERPRPGGPGETSRRWVGVALTLAASLTGCGGSGSPGPGSTASASPGLSGRVTSSMTGGPVASATVTVLDGANAGRTATTGADGRYRLDGLVNGGFSLRVSAARFDDAAEPVTLSGGATVDVRMARAACEASSCGAEPSACNETLPLFQRPFEGARAVSNLFDHEFPLSGQDPEPGFRSYCGGGNGRGGINGHDGIDWVMPEGTPLLAVADATVAVAGIEQPFSCPLLGGREVAAQYVSLIVETPHAERLTVQYVHASQLLVATGQRVRAGETVALSGNTGCSTGPHLHFQVLRPFVGVGGRLLHVDPYGWQGVGYDPWARKPDGASSAWLWVDAPSLRSARGEPAASEAAEPVLDLNHIEP